MARGADIEHNIGRDNAFTSPVAGQEGLSSEMATEQIGHTIGSLLADKLQPLAERLTGELINDIEERRAAAAAPRPGQLPSDEVLAWNLLQLDMHRTGSYPSGQAVDAATAMLAGNPEPGLVYLLKPEGAK